MWQDIFLTIISLLFSYALIPQIISSYKTKKGYIAFQTSIITFIGLYITVVIYVSLGLYISAITNLICSAAWYILLLQGILYR